MIIADHKSITDIQKEFSQKFPYLKIEFYKKSHEAEEGLADAYKWGSDKTIGEIRSTHNKGDLSITPDQTIGNLESTFWDLYNLSVQVFYKSGGIWLQTTKTDDRTLKEMNDRAARYVEMKEE